MNELDKYYFVERKKKSVAGNGITPKREVKGHFCGGWWRASNNKSIRDKLGNDIGSVMSLTYYSYKNSNQRREESIKTDWIMHEFKLKEDKFQEWVLCRIRDGSKRINKKLTVGGSENLQLQISPMNIDDDDQYLSTCGSTRDQVLAVGYRFEPTDEELLSDYLRRKLNGEQQLPSNAVIDMDIYACEPWFLSYDIHGSNSNMDNDEHERDRYYFVSRQKKCVTSDRGKMPDRDVKGKFDVGGYWKASSGDKYIRNTRNLKVIGYIKTLTFYKYKSKNRNRRECMKTDWIMHEYSLSRDTFQKWVVCRIRDNSKKSKEEGKPNKNEGSDESYTNITCEEEIVVPNMELVTPNTKNEEQQQRRQERFANMSHMSSSTQLQSNNNCEGKSDMELENANGEYLNWLEHMFFDDHEEQQKQFSNMSHSHTHQELLQEKRVQEQLKPMEIETADEEYLNWLELICFDDDEEQQKQFSNMSHSHQELLQEKGVQEQLKPMELEIAYTKDGEYLTEEQEEHSLQEKSDMELKTADMVYKDLSWLQDVDFPFLQNKDLLLGQDEVELYLVNYDE